MKLLDLQRDTVRRALNMMLRLRVAKAQRSIFLSKADMKDIVQDELDNRLNMDITAQGLTQIGLGGLAEGFREDVAMYRYDLGGDDRYDVSVSSESDNHFNRTNPMHGIELTPTLLRTGFTNSATARTDEPRIMALDLGQSKIGVALSRPPHHETANALLVLPRFSTFRIVSKQQTHKLAEEAKMKNDRYPKSKPRSRLPKLGNGGENLLRLLFSVGGKWLDASELNADTPRPTQCLAVVERSLDELVLDLKTIANAHNVVGTVVGLPLSVALPTDLEQAEAEEKFILPFSFMAKYLARRGALCADKYAVSMTHLGNPRVPYNYIAELLRLDEITLPSLLMWDEAKSSAEAIHRLREQGLDPDRVDAYAASIISRSAVGTSSDWMAMMREIDEKTGTVEAIQDIEAHKQEKEKHLMEVFGRVKRQAFTIGNPEFNKRDAGRSIDDMQGLARSTLLNNIEMASRGEIKERARGDGYFADGEVSHAKHIVSGNVLKELISQLDLPDHEWEQAHSQLEVEKRAKERKRQRALLKGKINDGDDNG